MPNSSSRPDMIKPPHYTKVPGFIPRNYIDKEPRLVKEEAQIIDVSLQSQKLISSCEGLIKKILLTIPTYAVSDIEGEGPNPIKAIYLDLFNKLPHDIEFIIVVHKGTEDEVNTWLKKYNRDKKSTIIPLPNDIHFSVWAEDAHSIVHDSGTNKYYFVEPIDFVRYGDSLVAEYVSNATEFDSIQTPLHFQGGNILIGDDFFLIGADYPRLTLRYVNNTIIKKESETDEEAVYRAFCNYLDPSRKLFYIKSSVPVPIGKERKLAINEEQWTEEIYVHNADGTLQPIFHIDMFVTLIGRNDNGKYQVLVGSPKLAADLLGIPLWDHSMNDVFDSIAENLVKDGFEVHRNPLPLAYVDDVSEKRRSWYFCTYNNALVEFSKEKGKTVWLPTYGYEHWKELSEIDKRNVEIWESFGYKVVQLTDCHPLAANLGVLHCIKKYLKRGK
ncbi:hypothetical protein ABEP50_29480 [Priestia megaterium]